MSGPAPGKAPTRDATTGKGEDECPGALRDLNPTSPDSSLPFGMTWEWGNARYSVFGHGSVGVREGGGRGRCGGILGLVSALRVGRNRATGTGRPGLRGRGTSPFPSRTGRLPLRESARPFDPAQHERVFVTPRWVGGIEGLTSDPLPSRERGWDRPFHPAGWIPDRGPGMTDISSGESSL